VEQGDKGPCADCQPISGRCKNVASIRNYIASG
jgi:hypothetical protein